MKGRCATQPSPTSTISGTALVDLTRCAERFAARYPLGVLAETPDGADTVVLIGHNAPGYEALSILREHRSRLNLQMWGSPHTVGAWITALRAESGGWPA